MHHPANKNNIVNIQILLRKIKESFIGDMPKNKSSGLDVKDNADQDSRLTIA